MTSGVVVIVADETMSACAKFGVEIAGGFCRKTFRAQICRDLFGIGRRAVPDADSLDRPHRRMRLGEEGRQRAGADHQQPRGVLAGEIGGGQRRGASGAPLRQPLAVDQRLRFAGGAVEQEIEPHHRRLADGVVVGRDGDDLDADMTAGRRAGRVEVGPGRHQQQRRGGAVGPFDRVMMPHRLHGAVAKSRAQRLDQAGKVSARSTAAASIIFKV